MKPCGVMDQRTGLKQDPRGICRRTFNQEVQHANL